MAFGRFLAGLAAGLAIGGPAAAECNFAKVGEIPLVMRGPRPLVQARINGKDALLLLDTGAFFSTLTEGGARRLGLAAAAEDRVKSYGLGGEQKIRNAKTEEVVLGNFVTRGAEFLVAQGMSGLDAPEDAVVGVLGQNHFYGADLEFDFANKVVRVFEPKGCEKANLAYWAPDKASTAPLMGAGVRTGEFVTNVTINGKKVVAQFDSGAPLTVLHLDRAAAAGIDVNQPTAKAIDPIGGFGPKSLPAWIAPFDSFSIGEETITKSRFIVAEMDRNIPEEVATGSHLSGKVVSGPDMLLGWDFFQAHRIYMARSQKRMYFTYNGGPVFKLNDAVAR